MSCSHWLLGCAVAFEVLWAALLKRSDGFSEVWSSAVMLVAYLASLAFLNLACRQIAVSVAYPVWTGIGGALVVLVGVVLHGEPLGVGRALGIALVIGGAAILMGFEPGTVAR